MQVVALCSKHHTEVSLVGDFCSALSFWQALCPVTQPNIELMLMHQLLVHSPKLCPLTKHALMHARCGCRSMLPPIDAPLQQSAPLPTQPYDHRKTYIAIISSDGDNMQACYHMSCKARNAPLTLYPGLEQQSDQLHSSVERYNLI